MAEASFRFYAELNGFLPREQRQRDIAHAFREPATLKDRIEAHGVPHTEVDLIQVDGAPARFEDRLRDGQRVSVYPFLAVVPCPMPLRPPFPRGRFVLDQHLSRLAAYLRLLGQDAVHFAHCPDEELARITSEEDRVLLTRDMRLLMRSVVVHGGFVHATAPQKQVVEVLHRFGAPETIAPFTRCMACNGRLRPVPKEEVADRIPPETRRFYDRFWTCDGCARVYWEGSHVRRMRQWVGAWLSDPDVTLGR
jgi:uncharacterized protein with PIN domain